MLTNFLHEPSFWLSISEIKSHPWVKGEKATHEEVKEEMERRLSLKNPN